MKRTFIVLLISGITSISFAQENTDFLDAEIKSIYDNISIGSLRQNIQPSSDSLTFQRIDSIRNEFNLTADSIKSQYQNSVSEIDAERKRIYNSIDSLNHFSLPAAKYTKSLDSLNQRNQTIERQFSSKLDALKSKTTGKLNSLDLPPKFKEPIQNLTKNIDGLNLNSGIVKIPKVNTPDLSLPEVDGISDLKAKAGKIVEIGNLRNLPEFETPAGEAGQLTQHVKSYEEDIQNITQGNLEDVQAIPETIEEQATKIDGMEALQKQSAVIDGHKARFDKLTDPNEAKEKVVEVGRKAAVDHFAGKQEQLKAAMEKISKYKQKYSSVSSIKDLPKRPPNPMKGKPFIERLVPGLYLQYQQKHFYLLDVNPYVGYKLSGRFITGLGWNHRYAYDKNNRAFSSRSKIFGPRGFADFRLGKGFIAHLEGEAMNAFVPSTLIGNPDTGHREWVWSIMTGIKKEYKIYKNLKGTALIQYNLFNRYFKAPYVDRLNSRIGFEYTLKKATKPHPLY